MDNHHQGKGMIIREEKDFCVVFLCEANKAALYYPAHFGRPFRLGTVIDCQYRPINKCEATLFVPFLIYGPLPTVRNEINELKIVDNRCLLFFSFNLAAPVKQFEWWSKQTSQFVLNSDETEYIFTEFLVLDKSWKRTAPDVMEHYKNDPTATQMVGCCEFMRSFVPDAAVTEDRDPRNRGEGFEWVWTLKEIVSTADEYCDASERKREETNLAPKPQAGLQQRKLYRHKNEYGLHYIPVNRSPINDPKDPREQNVPAQHPPQNLKDKNGGPKQHQKQLPRPNEEARKCQDSMDPRGPSAHAQYSSQKGREMDSFTDRMGDLNMKGLNRNQECNGGPSETRDRGGDQRHKAPAQPRGGPTGYKASPEPLDSHRAPLRHGAPSEHREVHRPQYPKANHHEPRSTADATHSKIDALRREADYMECLEMVELMSGCVKSIELIWSNPELRRHMKALNIEAFTDVENFLREFPKMRKTIGSRF